MYIWNIQIIKEIQIFEDIQRYSNNQRNSKIQRYSKKLNNQSIIPRTWLGACHGEVLSQWNISTKWADCIENAQFVTSVYCKWPISIFLANSAYELWPMAFLLVSYWSIISGNNILIGQCVTWCQHCNQVFYSAQYITKLQCYMTIILLFL